MTRRLIATLIGALALLALTATPALAQVETSPEVLPDVVENTTTTVEVLPATGGDVGGTVLLGLSLTAAGVTLAVLARRRRSTLAA